MFDTKDSFVAQLAAFDAVENQARKMIYEQALRNYSESVKHANPSPFAPAPPPSAPLRVKRTPFFEPTWGFTLSETQDPVSTMTIEDLMPRFQTDDPDMPGPVGRLIGIVNGEARYYPSSTDTYQPGQRWTAPDGTRFFKTGDTPIARYWIKL